MKKTLLLSGLILFLAACKPGGGDKKAELDQLKKQEVELKSKIAALETELKAGGDSASSGISVSVLPLKAEIFKNYIDVQGRVDADQNVALSTEMPGTI